MLTVLARGAIAAVALTPQCAGALAATAIGHASVTILPAVGGVAPAVPISLHLAPAETAGDKLVVRPDGTVIGSLSRPATAKAQPGVFTVLGPPNSSVAVSFRAAQVTGPGPAMSIGIVTDEGPSLALDGAGRLALSVGATVLLGETQPAGAYRGRYRVIVNY